MSALKDGISDAEVHRTVPVRNSEQFSDGAFCVLPRLFDLVRIGLLPELLSILHTKTACVDREQALDKERHGETEVLPTALRLPYLFRC